MDEMVRSAVRANWATFLRYAQMITYLDLSAAPTSAIPFLIEHLRHDPHPLCPNLKRVRIGFYLMPEDLFSFVDLFCDPSSKRYRFTHAAKMMSLPCSRLLNGESVMSIALKRPLKRPTGPWIARGNPGLPACHQVAVCRYTSHGCEPRLRYAESKSPHSHSTE